MSLILPYTFTGGKSAKAQEVNANFVAVKNQIDTILDNIDTVSNSITNIQVNYALLNGNATERFNVATPTTANNAASKAYVDAQTNLIKFMIAGLRVVKSGNQAFYVSRGSCYNTALTYPMELTNNLAVDISGLGLTASSTYNVYVTAETPSSLATVATITTATIATAEPSDSSAIYRLVGTITLDSSGNISATTSEGNSYGL